MAGKVKNREKGIQGSSLPLDVRFNEYQGGPLVDDDNFNTVGTLPIVKIYDPTGNVTFDSSVVDATQPVRISLGSYEFTHAIGIQDSVSTQWKVEWTITINSNTLNFSELFTIVEAGSASFGTEEFRVGFAFDNPDLTSTHHASIYDTTDEAIKGWGLLVAPDELRYVESFGTRLVSPDASQTFNDSMIMWYIDNAIAMVERDLNIDIFPRVVRHENPVDQSRFISSGGSLDGTGSPIRTEGEVTERVDLPPESEEPNRVREGGYPYRLNNAQHYMYVKLKRRPLIDVLKAVMVDPVQNTVIDLYSWRRETKGFESKLQFFPNLTAVGNYPYFPSTNLQVEYPFHNLPDAMYFDYRTGFLNAADVPKELRSVVQWTAAIPFLLTLGRGKTGGGLANASVNLNSISETFGTTMSATSTLYGADIITLQNLLKDWWKKNAQKYRRDIIGVL